MRAVCEHRYAGSFAHVCTTSEVNSHISGTCSKVNWSNVKKICAYSCHSVNINLLENAIGILRESNKGRVLEMQSAL